MANFLDAVKKPGRLQILVAVFLILFFSFYVRESVCAAGIFFAFCVSEHGFPAVDMITGSIDGVPSEMLEEKFFGNFFMKRGNALINPAGIIFNAIIYYLFVSFLFYISNIKVKV